MTNYPFDPQLDAYLHDRDDSRFVLWVTLGPPSVGAELCIHNFLRGTVRYSWTVRGKRGPRLPLPKA